MIPRKLCTVPQFCLILKVCIAAFCAELLHWNLSLLNVQPHMFVLYIEIFAKYLIIFAKMFLDEIAQS